MPVSLNKHKAERNADKTVITKNRTVRKFNFKTSVFLQISQLFLVSFNNPLQTALVTQHKTRVYTVIGNGLAPLWSITVEFACRK